MHSSSQINMTLFKDKYLDKDKKLSILDVGSIDVNGSYKTLFDNPNWSYLGMDMSGGKNVDVVSEPYHFSFKDNSFDVIACGQVLEHVEDMFSFIKEINRILKLNGVVCCIAPSEFHIHRFPVDCWRILPDGMNFLLSKIGKLKILEIYSYKPDCIGIAIKEKEGAKC